MSIYVLSVMLAVFKKFSIVSKSSNSVLIDFSVLLTVLSLVHTFTFERNLDPSLLL